MEHIKTPIGLCWEGRKFKDILDADGNLIASSVPTEYARELEKVINSHADLLAACEALLAADKARTEEGLHRPRYEAIKQAKAAIAKAKGE